MAQLTMVTGGSKSGKSVYAEQQLDPNQHICYIATGVMFQDDVEMARRIKHHQERRSSQWTTREQYEHVDQLFGDAHLDAYLLDDATMLTTNLFFKKVGERAAGLHEGNWDKVINAMSTNDVDDLDKQITTEWRQILAAIEQAAGRVFIVTNEVGLGLVPATKEGRILRDLYGEINQLIAASATHVVFVVSGIPVSVK